MNTTTELLNSIITTDFPDEPVPSDINLVFCGEELLSPSHKATILNFLRSPYSSDSFMVNVYAAFEDGHIGKYRSLLPLSIGEIPDWAFCVLTEKQKATCQKLSAFALYLIRPSDSTVYKRITLSAR